MNKRYADDGITHINIYSKGKTELGRFLSNFTRCPIETEDGPFVSIEGYWYWLSCKAEKLRTLSGYAAKAYGRLAGANDWGTSDEFKRKITDAIYAKLRTPEGVRILSENRDLLHLPFDHYYVYGNKINRPREGRWIIERIQEYTNKYYRPN